MYIKTLWHTQSRSSILGALHINCRPAILAMAVFSWMGLNPFSRVANAQVTVSSDWHNYAVVGLSSLTFSDDTPVTGSVYAGRDLSSMYQLSTTGSAYSGGNFSDTFLGVISGNVAANGSIAAYTINGSAVYGTTFSGTVVGSKIQSPNSVPTIALPPPTAFSPGSSNISVNGSLSLTPGSYGDLSVTGFGGLSLSSGTYYFRSFFETASGNINLDLSGGPIRIYVAQDLNLGSFTLTKVNGATPSAATQSLAGNVLWEVHGNANVPISTFWTNFFGTLFVPYGSVNADYIFNNHYGQVLAAGPSKLAGPIVGVPSNLLSNPNLLLKGTDATVITGGTINAPVAVTSLAATGSANIGYTLNVAAMTGSSVSMSGATPPSNSIAPGATQANTVAISSTQLGVNYLSLRAVDPGSGTDLETGSFQLNVLNHAQPLARNNSPARVMLGTTANGSAQILNNGTGNAGLLITSTGGLTGIAVGDLLASGTSRTVNAPIDTSVTGIATSATTYTVGISDDTSLPGATPLPAINVNVAAAVLDNRRVTAAGPVDMGFVHVNGAASGTLNLQTTGDDNHFTRITVNNASADTNGVSVTGTSTFSFGLSGLTQSRTLGGTITKLGSLAGSFSLITNAEAGVTGTQVLANVPVSYTLQSYSGKANWNSATGANWGGHTNWIDTLSNATGGAPGIASIVGDTATFGNSIGASAATVSLNGVSPALAAITFDNNQGGSYSVLPGTGGAISIAAATSANAVNVVNGSHRIGTPLTITGSSIINVGPTGSSLTLDGPITSAIGLTKNGAGSLLLTGANSITGAVTINAGTLSGSVAGLTNNIVDNGLLVMEQPIDASFGGLMTGAGSFAKSGVGKLTLAGADTFQVTGGMEIRQGTLALPFGAPRSNGAVALQAAGTLEAAGNVPHAISGVGAVTATGDLFLGRSTQPGQFNLGGAPGTGGVLNVNANAVVVLSSNEIVLGSSTQILDGGSLTTLHGARLGNPTSLDVTKVLTASGNSTINGDFTNNGAVHGPTAIGQWLMFTQQVHGAGSLSGNVEFLGSYSPGNSPAIVSSENLLLDSTNTLTMEIGGPAAGQFDQLQISGLATLNGTLNVSLLGGYVLEPGLTYQLFQGATTGQFQTVNNLPVGWTLDYATGSLTSVPEPASFMLLACGTLGIALFARQKRLR